MSFNLFFSLACNGYIYKIEVTVKIAYRVAVLAVVVKSFQDTATISGAMVVKMCIWKFDNL